MALTAVLLQGCAQQAPAGPAARVYAVDLAGAAKRCTVSDVALAPGKPSAATMQVGNDGGWCAITVANSGKPFSAGLVDTPPTHGKLLVHTVGDKTRIDYTPARGYAGPDSFQLKLIPGDAAIGTTVTVGPP